MLKLRKISLIIGYVCYINIFSVTPAIDTANSVQLIEYTEFIQDFFNKVVVILKKNPDTQIQAAEKEKIFQEQKKSFKNLITTFFHMKYIAQVAASRYWALMNPEQKEEYQRLLINISVNNYTKQFDNYHNEKFVTKSARIGKNKSVMVTSYIVDNNQKELIELKWEIFKTKNGLKITDIKIDKISMLFNIKIEYYSILSDSNTPQTQRINKLLAYMQKKLN